MKVTVRIKRLMGKGAMGMGVSNAAATLIGYRQKEGEETVELFRLPISGQVNKDFEVVKYYANPEGGVSLGEFWMEMETSEKSEFSFSYNVTLDHAPPIKANQTKPEDASNAVDRSENNRNASGGRAVSPFSLEVLGDKNKDDDTPPINA